MASLKQNKRMSKRIVCFLKYFAVFTCVMDRLRPTCRPALLKLSPSLTILDSNARVSNKV